MKPHYTRGKVDRGEKVARAFVVAGSDGTELFQLGEEILYQMASDIKMLVILPRFFAIGFGWNYRGFTGCRQRLEDSLIGIECFVGDQNVCLHVRQQVVGTDQIMGLPTGDVEAYRTAERINQGMDFGAQPPARAPDRLVFAGFFLAPALC